MQLGSVIGTHDVHIANYDLRFLYALLVRCWKKGQAPLTRILTLLAQIEVFQSNRTPWRGSYRIAGVFTPEKAIHYASDAI